MLTTMYINMIRSFFSNLLFLVFHFGCFTFSSHHRHGSSSRFKKGTLISSIKRFFSSSSSSSCNIPYQPPLPSIPSPSSSTRSLRVGEDVVAGATTKGGVIVSNIRPCSVCGEIFQSSTLLQHHHAAKHAVSELIDGENIVRIIFCTGWPEKAKSPTIHRILKIHNTPKTVARFEEYRERVKLRAEAAAAAAAKIKALSWNERCIADGNELLRFYCTTFICSSLQEDSRTCNQQYCSACGIIINGFSQKMDGISTLPTSWRAHTAIPEDLEDEFSFMHVKRALLVCRVIAGRVGCDPDDPGFDSLMGSRSGVFEDELLVFSPRAVLPCFVIVYTV